VIVIKQTATFAKWEARLRDKRAKTMIATRLARLAQGLPGDVEPVGENVSELGFTTAPATASISSNVANFWLCCCVVGTRKHSPATLPRRRSWPKNGAHLMAEKLTTYDPTTALVDDEEMAVFMADAFETGDAGYIAHALGIVARAKGMTQIARDTGLSREQLYRSFSEEGNPTLKTTLAVMKALSIDLTARPHTEEVAA
jgi:probable addiction module antidote protein